MKFYLRLNTLFYLNGEKIETLFAKPKCRLKIFGENFFNLKAFIRRKNSLIRDLSTFLISVARTELELN